MKWHLCLVIAAFVTSLSAKAEKSESITQNPPLVEVYHQEDSLVPYRERRSNSGLMFSINSENFLPKNYLSTLDNVIYSDIFGDTPIAIIGAEISYKYNFSLGALGFGAGYGAGSVSSDEGGDSRSMTITRPFASVTFMMDSLFAEPFVVPYAELKAWQLGISEQSNTDSFSATTEMGFTYSIGALIQLNGLDEDTSRNATHNYGLENTYLDFYMAKHTQTQGSTDADTETDFDFGAGLRLEF